MREETLTSLDGLLPHALIACALLVWLGWADTRKRQTLGACLTLSTLSVSVAILQGYVPWWGVLILLTSLLMTQCVGATPLPSKGLTVPITLLQGALTFALAIHAFGWTSLVLNPAMDLGGEPFVWKAHFDKPFAASLIVIFLLSQPQSTPRLSLRMLSRMSFLIVSGTSFLIFMTLKLGGSLDLKVSWTAMGFLLANLLFTVIPEELFFRGLIQAYLPSGSHAKTIITIFITALLFTMAHFSGSLLEPYLLLVFLAGLLYAAVYQFSRSIPLAVAAHLTVNAASVLVFQYPIRLA